MAKVDWATGRVPGFTRPGRGHHWVLCDGLTWLTICGKCFITFRTHRGQNCRYRDAR